MRYLISILLFVCSFVKANADNYTFDYNSNCSRAYQNFLSLHNRDGRVLIIAEMKSNPYNLMATYVADYEDCILLLLNCNKDDYRERSGHFDARVELIEKGSRSSPWYRLCLGGIYLHWALINTRFGEQYKAAINFHRSFALLKENRRLFPHFEYNKVFAGLQDAVVGSLPGNYKWLASIFGMRGDLRKGIAELNAFVTTHTTLQPLYEEAMLYYVYTRFYLLAEQNEAWEILNGPQFNTSENLLNTFVKTNIALDYRKAEAAIETLQIAKTEEGYSLYPVFSYQMGVALYNKLDTGCFSYFRQYLATNKSDLLIKDCWQRMAFTWYLNGNKLMANDCLQQVVKQGSTRSDADKQADKFAENKVWPDRKLLAARLLIEGGYYARALAMLNEINEAKLTEADRIECSYRYGKTYQELGDKTNSTKCFQAAINTGKNRHEQYAARAALQLGLLYEREGRRTEALKLYKECLDMPYHDFQNSIDQQAKAGINRIEVR